jgi:hypothetical protein
MPYIFFVNGNRIVLLELKLSCRNIFSSLENDWYRIRSGEERYRETHVIKIRLFVDDESLGWLTASVPRFV